MTTDPNHTSRPRTTTVLAATAGAVAVILGAVAFLLPVSTRDTAQLTSPTPTPIPTTAAVPATDPPIDPINDPDIRSDPWPAKATVPVSAEEARRAVFNGDARADGATLALRLVSSSSASGGLPRRPTPYWVVTWTHAGAGPGGAMPVGVSQEESDRIITERNRQFAAMTCVAYVFVNAQTRHRSATTEQCA